MAIGAAPSLTDYPGVIPLNLSSTFTPPTTSGDNEVDPIVVTPPGGRV